MSVKCFTYICPRIITQRTMKLTLLELIELFYWYLMDEWRYNSYQYWISIGVLPRYAFEKAKNKL